MNRINGEYTQRREGITIAYAQPEWKRQHFDNGSGYYRENSSDSSEESKKRSRKTRHNGRNHCSNSGDNSNEQSYCQFTLVECCLAPREQQRREMLEGALQQSSIQMQSVISSVKILIIRSTRIQAHSDRNPLTDTTPKHL